MTHQIDEPTQRFIPDERRYFSYRRPGGVDGVCNICQCRKRLTFDHVPPAGCDNRENVEVNSLLSVMRGVTGENKPTIIQSGLKYRTICKQCNELLGSRYDPALIGLTKSVRAALASPLLPKRINVRTRPAAILRSIIGHLVAAKVETDSSQFDNEVVSCISDETAPVPEKYQLYYWIHPHDKTVVMRDSLSIDTAMPSGTEHTLFQLLKFFPFGFWVLDRSRRRPGDFSLVRPAVWQRLRSGGEKPGRVKRVRVPETVPLPRPLVLITDFIRIAILGAPGFGRGKRCRASDDWHCGRKIFRLRAKKLLSNPPENPILISSFGQLRARFGCCTPCAA